MCTLTIIPIHDHQGEQFSYRVVMSRDELRSRAPALPPQRSHVRNVEVIHPVDAESGGAWILANSHGVAFCLLNVNITPPPDLTRIPNLRSRGTILPEIADARSAIEATDRHTARPLDAFAPHRLVCVDRENVAQARWDGEQVDASDRPLAPMCFVSSGLGDHFVEPRLGLFHSMLASEPLTPVQQDAYHHHRWADRPEVSVLMTRSDARTVSITTVHALFASAAGARSEMVYETDDLRTEIVLDSAADNSAKTGIEAFAEQC